MPYTDSTGRLWPMTIDLPACRRVRDLVGVNLLTLDVPDIFRELADPIRLCEVLYAVCKPDADAAGVDLDGFLRRIKGDIPHITSQLLEGLAAFFRLFRQPTKATTLMDRWAMTTGSGSPSQSESPRTEPTRSGTAATNCPGSLESTPTSQA